MQEIVTYHYNQSKENSVTVTTLYQSDEYLRLKLSDGLGLYYLYQMLEYTYPDSGAHSWIITISIGSVKGRLVSLHVYDNISSWELEKRLEGRFNTSEEFEMFKTVISRLMKSSI